MLLQEVVNWMFSFDPGDHSLYNVLNQHLSILTMSRFFLEDLFLSFTSFGSRLEFSVLLMDDLIYLLYDKSVTFFIIWATVVSFLKATLKY